MGSTEEEQVWNFEQISLTLGGKPTAKEDVGDDATHCTSLCDEVSMSHLLSKHCKPTIVVDDEYL